MRKENMPGGGKQHITICVCTFRRAHLLEELLFELNRQVNGDLFSYSVVIVDNDPDGSAKPVVESLADRLAIHIDYYHEGERNISLARNRCIREARGDFIAFIDDDEVPEKDWLLSLYQLLVSSDADGVLGPVRPLVDPGIPKWLLKSGLLERRGFATGYRITSASDTRTGNVLFQGKLFNHPEASFDPKYGRSGGGDVEFFQRMMLQEKVFVWCDEGVVYEYILPERRTAIYYLKRAFTRGVTNAWKSPFFSVETLKSFLAIPIYTVLLPFCAALGPHVFMKYLVKYCDHMGKILCYMGVQVVKERPYGLTTKGALKNNL